MPSTTRPAFTNMAEVLAHLGDIPPERVRVRPAPGTATERDLVRLNEKKDRLYELIDGVLVEKTMGMLDAYMAVLLIRLLDHFVDQHDLGIVLGPDGATRLMPGLVLVPDVSFIAWEQLPVRGVVPDAPFANLAPALAVEVLSPSNTVKEMQRKLKDYFLAGVRLVWYVDPRTRRVTVYTAPDQAEQLSEDDTLTGGDVLPGFQVAVRELFSRAPRKRSGKGRKKSK
jgi:Uma2 family endonuclease